MSGRYDAMSAPMPSLYALHARGQSPVGRTGSKNRDSHDDANVALCTLLHAQGVLIDDAVDGEQEGRPREVPAGCGEEGGRSRVRATVGDGLASRRVCGRTDSASP